jgi:hypothetical protein
MRFAGAVVAAATLDLVVLLRIDDWVGTAALLAIAYLLLGSAGAGFFAGRRAALAGALAVLGGAILSGIAQYLTRPDRADPLALPAVLDFLGFLGFELQLAAAFVPYAIGGAAAGAIGGALRRRAAGAAR